ncbi:Pentatricopeptide repeat-containing protein [Glycine soja]|nr:Pentatricopeptide repeat-containing protein [Glycine soja]
MIRDSTNNGFFTQTLNIYRVCHGNNLTYPLLLKACANLPSIQHGTMLHGHVLKFGFQADTFVQTSLVGMYSKCSHVASTRQVFDEMPQRSVVSWNAMVSAYSRGSLMDQALTLLKEIWVLGFEPTASTFVSILSGYSNLDSFGFHLLGKSIHYCLIKLGIVYLEVSLAYSLMGMYVQFCLMHSGHTGEALDLFRSMIRTDIRPNGATLATVLSACAALGSLSIGQEIEEYIFLSGLESEQQVQMSLIHMYSKCGSIMKAREVSERVTDKDLTVWTSMINSYAIHGMGNEAISLFHKMTTAEGIMPLPDAIAYTSVLLACSHSGLVEERLKYFKSMQKDFEIAPTVEHCTCLIDLLGRVSQLHLALDAIQGMPPEVQAQAWGPLFDACGIHGNVELGEIATVRLLDSSPGSSESYVLMANLYASLGKWKEAHMMRNLIDGKGLVKECGWSQVEVSGS